MKKFILNICIFSIVILVSCFCIGSLRISDEYIISKTKGTSYEKIAWNLNLINTHPEKIKGSVLFFGPSLVQGGICDSLLTTRNVPSINFGTNGAGNEIELFFLKKTLRYKPAKVYLHLFKGPHKDFHNMTPLLYDPVTLISLGQNVNLNYLLFLLKRTSYTIDYLVSSAVGITKPSGEFNRYGVVYDEQELNSDRYATIDLIEMRDFFESFQLSKYDFIKSTESKRSGMFFKIIQLRRKLMFALNNSDLVYNTSSQSAFEQKQFQLCEEYGVPAVSFYMPMIADVKSNKNFAPAFYDLQKKGKVVSLSNFMMLDSSVYWSDMTHLSKKGALLFTNELILKGLIDIP